MASIQQSATMETLPGEVLSNIFIRLLAKQLAQMRCVSKSWYSLLRQPSFIKSHFRRSIHNNNGIVLVFPKDFSFDRRPCSARPSRSHNLQLTNLVNLPIKRYGSGNGNLIGSVNGLICFSFGPYLDYVFYIWNPSLCVALTLPRSSFHTRDYDVVDPRFGYDPKTDDYKVVKVTNDPTNGDNKVEVYSMRKGCWKSIAQRFPSHVTFLDWKTEVCVDGYDGYVHWLGNVDKKWDRETIVAFDLAAETFREIPLPESILCYDGSCSSVLGVMGGKLCVMTEKGIDFEVWVMDDYGAPQSWVKHHVYSLSCPDITPYGFTLRNEFLFEDKYNDEYNDEVGDDRRSRLFDSVAAGTKTFDIRTGPFIIYKIVEYVDSLVWVSPDDRETSCSSNQVANLNRNQRDEDSRNGYKTLEIWSSFEDEMFANVIRFDF